MSHYTGIGSRQTPEALRFYFNAISIYAESRGLRLRSGGADGADSFFEEKVNEKDIYLPWEGFNGNKSNLFRPTQKAYEIAEKFHPNWYVLSRGVKAMMARNTHQILGDDCKTPSKFVTVWTKFGKYIGGTSQALRIASSYNIPIFNFGDIEFTSEQMLQKVVNFINNIK